MPVVEKPSRLSLHVLKLDSTSGAQALPGALDASQKSRIMLQPIAVEPRQARPARVEPIVLRGKTDENARRPAMPGDEDFFLFGQAQVFGQFVLRFIQGHGFRGFSPAFLAGFLRCLFEILAKSMINRQRKLNLLPKVFRALPSLTVGLLHVRIIVTHERMARCGSPRVSKG
jgi:hypothetical protein